MFNQLKLFYILTLVLVTPSCSVYKAASNEGISTSDIIRCKDERCFLSKGMNIIDQRIDPEGKCIVTYRSLARKSGVNYLRAAGHGVLDVMTFGVWEIAGTPVEGAISNNRGYIIAQTIYTNNLKEQINSIKIYDVNGKLVLNQNT